MRSAWPTAARVSWGGVELYFTDPARGYRKGVTFTFKAFENASARVYSRELPPPPATVFCGRKFSCCFKAMLIFKAMLFKAILSHRCSNKPPPTFFFSCQ